MNILRQVIKAYPGLLAFYFAALERAHVDYAAHACWWESVSSAIHNGCVDHTMDGLLTEDSDQPTPLWWMYKTYANMTGKIVSVSGNGITDGVVSYDSSSNTGVILGGVSQDTSTTQVHIQGIPSGFSQMHIVLTTIPNFGYNQSLTNPKI